MKGPETNSWWASGGWTHAFMMYDRSTVFEIQNEGYVSEKKGLNRIYNMISSGYYKEFIVLRMGLNNREQSDMRRYIDNNLLGIPYEITLRITNKTFYCSSLVWWTHKYSGKKIDFDSDGGFMVDPEDLILSNYVKSKNHIKY